MVLINCASTKWKGNLFGDISHLREEGNCADVRLVAGAGSTVSLAHSLVLAAARSDANNQHICACCENLTLGSSFQKRLCEEGSRTPWEGIEISQKLNCCEFV